MGLFWTGPTPFGLWFFLAWSIVAGFVLRQTWLAVKIDVEPDGRRMRFARRFPRLAAPIPMRSAVAVVSGCLLLATAYGWATGDSIARFGIVIVGVMFGLIAILLWLTDS
ncbi:MAG TPA: hypothetical protein VF351_08800 [Actinomycetota bacterium]